MSDYSWVDEEDVDLAAQRWRNEIEQERRRYISSHLGRPFDENVAQRHAASRPPSSQQVEPPADALVLSFNLDLAIDGPCALPSADAMRDELQRGRLQYMRQLADAEPDEGLSGAALW